ENPRLFGGFCFARKKCLLCPEKMSVMAGQYPYGPSLQPVSTAISTARLYSHLYSPLVLQCLEQAVSAAAVSGSG
ncbi:hypothetical protein FKR45_09905, partial [Neisseria meningitidis]|nr:hypothetical protein [Neisseria meningitidis]